MKRVERRVKLSLEFFAGRSIDTRKIISMSMSIGCSGCFVEFFEQERIICAMRGGRRKSFNPRVLSPASQIFERLSEKLIVSANRESGRGRFAESLLK